MKVLLARHSGFCFGVRRALRMAREAKAAGGEVRTLGELIHNPRIVSDLASEGIVSVDSATGISGVKVVLRSHGVSKPVGASAEDIAEYTESFIDF